MNELVSMIKQIAQSVFEQSKPVEVCYGLVVQEEDKNTELKIRLQQKQVLSKNYFVNQQKLNEVETGQKVILLRVQGGQQYYILEVLPK